MRLRIVVLVLSLPGCWSSTPASPTTAPANTANPQAADDPTIERDVARVGAYADGHGEPFTAVELVGWTETRGLLYRTAVCDPDELGGRGAYCDIDVCVVAATDPGAEPACESIVDITIYDKPPFDRTQVAAAVRAAEAARHPASRGKDEAPTLVRISQRSGDIGVSAESWFGPTRWMLFPAAADPDTGEEMGFTNPAITGVRSSDDGKCLAFSGIALRRSRYESVTGSIRTAFANQRCRK